MRKFLTGSFVALMTSTASMTLAATPPDTLVLAFAFDDTISLDPAEVFEMAPSEFIGNSYERITGYDPADPSKIFGVVAESWTISPDGKTFTFKVREGKKFASGNPLTAEDAVFSLQRVITLNKSPAFIIDQFGLTKDNVKDKIKQTGPYEFTFETDKAYAPSFVLLCLSSTPAAVVDKKLVLQNEKDGDLGYNWLKTRYAGSGPFTIRDWKPNEILVMERNPNYAQKTPMARVIYRMVKETTTQRLLLEKGDIDIARNLAGEDIEAVMKNDAITVNQGRKGTLWYLGLNMKNPVLAKPEVREAMRYLVDYQAISNTILKHQTEVQQYFVPQGLLGALKDSPYKLDPAKAKDLLVKAGYPDGFSVTIDARSVPRSMGTAQALQQSFAKVGIKLEIIPGDSKQILTKYRARKHDIYLGDWGVDYPDPNTNAGTFALNEDNSDDTSSKTLAWRNAWEPGPLNEKTHAAIQEKDTAKRAALYQDIQKTVSASGPFVLMFQQTEVWAKRKNVSGEVIGPGAEMNQLDKVKKN